MKTLKVIGLELACTDYQGAADWVLEHSTKGKAIAVEAANTHVAALSKHNEGFRNAMQKFDLVLPDGMPLVWVMNAKLKADQRLNDRVYGPTFMLEMLKASAGSDEHSHFFLGGAQSTLDKLHERFEEEFPDTNIAGSYSPPYGEWPDDEFDRIQSKIEESGANLIWVCFGCPKQERWIAENKENLPAGAYFGIGAAFAFHAGEVSQAPAILQKNGLEWAYRLGAEPRRLFKRYLVHNSLFIYYLLQDSLGLAKGVPR